MEPKTENPPPYREKDCGHNDGDDGQNQPPSRSQENLKPTPRWWHALKNNPLSRLIYRRVPPVPQAPTHHHSKYQCAGTPSPPAPSLGPPMMPAAQISTEVTDHLSKCGCAGTPFPPAPPLGPIMLDAPSTGPIATNLEGYTRNRTTSSATIASCVGGIVNVNRPGFNGPVTMVNNIGDILIINLTPSMPVIKNQLGGKFINIEAPFRAIQQSSKSHTSFHDCSAAVVANVAGLIVNLSNSVTIISNGGLIVNINLVPSTTTITNHTGMIFNVNIGDLPHETGNANSANFLKSIGRVAGEALIPYEDEYECSDLYERYLSFIPDLAKSDG
ncbi:hypothetical protein FQN52_008623 [Onygenales sp. PD_12]|nr:hypothetical protein FQN52_008623 [Onygenales sp. PD_12]